MSHTPFILFSFSHLIVFVLLFLSLLYLHRATHLRQRNLKRYERYFALILLGLEVGYHGLQFAQSNWTPQYNLPLELCSLTLFGAIILLWRPNQVLYQFVFYAGIAGAIQALITPVTDYGFPHYRYFHFFITHCGIIMTAFYFTWVKRGYRPTLKGIGQTMLILNILLPIILYLNHITGGNYMFLAEKPPSGSILDLLGPYPWYLLSLEIVATTMFLTLLLLFK